MVLSGPTGISNSSSQLVFMYPKYNVKEPSSLGIHPSYAGDTLCPFEYVNLVWAPVGCSNRRTDRRESTNRHVLDERILPQVIIGFLARPRSSPAPLAGPGVPSTEDSRYRSRSGSSSLLAAWPFRPGTVHP